MSTCEKCRHWGDEIRVVATSGGRELVWQARCKVDPARVAAPFTSQKDTCSKFAPELREYPKMELVA